MRIPTVRLPTIPRRAGPAAAGLMMLLLSACALPSAGPSYGEIAEAAPSADYGFHVLPVTPGIVRAARRTAQPGFTPVMLDTTAEAVQRFAVGDVLSITVWENIDEGLLNPAGIGASVLPQTTVDEGGQIFVPYIGRIRAAGRTTSQLRAAISARLAEKTLDPQVDIARALPKGRQISVQGAVKAPGLYPIEQPTTHLLAMLARAGGVVADPGAVRVKLRRGQAQGEIWLADLYDAPGQDVDLRTGDALIVERDRRVFTALGAVNGSRTVPFPMRDLSVASALGVAGGLNDFAADPTGVFLFREEPADTARKITALQGGDGPQRVAYIFDLTAPAGMFLARDFMMRDQDTIFVTNAPFVKWLKILQGISPLVSFGGSARTLGGF